MEELEKLKSLRAAFRRDYSDQIPIDFVSISKDANGHFGLAVHIKDERYDDFKLPRKYHGFGVWKERSSEFHLQ
ncbi:hypothetical protein [Roseivirga pacifica]|uniref:hypothetical protein n=1 Tax=Roseivirga pacifica TaxID=1267423 RepID=UPI003BAE4F68